MQAAQSKGGLQGSPAARFCAPVPACELLQLALTHCPFTHWHPCDSTHAPNDIPLQSKIGGGCRRHHTSLLQSIATPQLFVQAELHSPIGHGTPMHATFEFTQAPPFAAHT
jgi:hypothetical protein